MIYPPGPVHPSIRRRLVNYPFHEAYTRGEITRFEYVEELEASLRDLAVDGVHHDDLYLSSRAPIDRFKFANGCAVELEDLFGVKLDVSALIEAFDAFSDDMEPVFDHGNFSTYIYPEEALFAYLLVAAKNPSRIVFAGSYYAYWAIWFLAAASPGTEAILIDPNKEALELGLANIKCLLPKIDVQAQCATAEAALPNCAEYDLLVVDAEIPQDHPDRFLSGKGLYYDILLASEKTAAADCVLCCHNVILDEDSRIPYLQSKARLNEIELSDFLDHCHSHWGRLVTIETTEGIGIALRDQSLQKQ